MRRAVLTLIAVGFLVGCHPKPPPGGPKAYFGPTDRMAAVVAAVNANNAKLPTLWAEVAKARYDFVNDKGRRDSETLDGGVLLYQQSPRSVRLVGDALIGHVLELGSNQDVYWLSIKVGPDTAWWGHYENLGKPCSESLPIRPDLLFEVLGVSAFNPDLTAMPAPVMRFNPDADAYTFVWVLPCQDRYVATGEVWYDRKTKRPRVVVLYDVDGRVVLRAYLSKHEPVEVPNVPKEQWPAVATEYDLLFPDKKGGSRLYLQLGRVRLSNKGAPSRASFLFAPDAKRLGVSKVIQLDEDCGR
jgi:hypothetical protein